MRTGRLGVGSGPEPAAELCPQARPATCRRGCGCGKPIPAPQPVEPAARFELDRHPKLPLRRESEGENGTIACSARARLDLARYPAGTPEHEHANTVASQRQTETSPTTVQGNSRKSKALRIDRWRSWKVDSDPGGPEHVAKGS